MTDATNKMEQSDADLKARQEEGGRLLADQMMQAQGETDRPEDIEEAINQLLDNLNSGKETVIRSSSGTPRSLTEDDDLSDEEAALKFLDDLESGKEKVARSNGSIVSESDKLGFAGDIVSKPEEYPSDEE